MNRDAFQIQLLKDKLQNAEDGDGHYLLRAFRAVDQAATLRELHMALTKIEAAFRTLKSDLRLRPIRHQVELRNKAPIIGCFLASCLHVTLCKRLEVQAVGLTPRAVLEPLSGILMLDVHPPLPTGRELMLPRFTQSEPEQRLVLQKLGFKLPAQPLLRVRLPEILTPPKDSETK